MLLIRYLLLSIWFLVMPLEANQAQDEAVNPQLTPILDNKGWRLWRESQALTLHYRGFTNTPLIEIKVQARFTSSLAGFLLFLQDYPMIPNWLERAESSTLIRQETDTENLFITRFKGVWPVSKREMIIRSRYWQNPDLSVELKAQDASHELGKTNDIIRIKLIRSHWMLKPVSDGRLLVSHTMMADPKGTLPIWLVNQVSLRSMWASLRAMQQQLPLSPWQSMTIPWIQEFEANGN